MREKSLIDFTGSKLTVQHQCELINLPRSTAYHKLMEHKPSQDEIDIKNAIDQIHYKEPSYGVRRIRNELHKLSFDFVGRRLVKQYMQEMDIVAFYPDPKQASKDG